MRRVEQYLHDILIELEDVEEFASEGSTFFESDRRTQKAIIRSYEVIGEIVKRLPPDMLNNFPHVEWKEIAGFRDWLIHRYDDIDLKLVWQAVEKIPELKSAVETMLNSLNTSNAQET